jgi:hypothetical protein
MRLYSGKIPVIAREIVATLTKSGDLETESEAELAKDLEAVLTEYLRSEREIIDEAKTRMERQGMGYHMLTKVRSQVSKERNFPPPEEFLPYIMEQLLEMLLHSANVEELFAEDMALRTKLTPILKKHLQVDEALDREVRARIKNLEEGTAAYEIEYQRVLAQVKQKKQLG